MPRYFMHLVDSVDVILDPEGIEMPPEAVERASIAAARDCMAGDVKSGQLDLRCHIEVKDESGEVVHRLPFSDAVEVLSPT